MYQGLSKGQAQELLLKFGPNEIPEKRQSFLLKFSQKLLSPASLMLLAASILSFFLGKIFDFYFILLLLLLNVFITLWQENKADKSIQKLNEHLLLKVKLLRDGLWIEIDSKGLVPGDIIKLHAGEIVPADGKIVDGKNLLVNEAALTGESLPKEKINGEEVLSGSFLAKGIAVVEVTATGKQTSFGRTVLSVETIRKRSLLEKDILQIAKFLTLLSLVSVLILSLVFVLQKVSLIELLTLDLSLLVAGVPISLPTVMTLIIEFGVLALAAKKTIVRRLSALEDLANVNYLLTDKTGTLTKNEIRVKEIYPFGEYTRDQVILYAFLATSKNSSESIDQAVMNQASLMGLNAKDFKSLDFIPADSERKRSTALFQKGEEKITISLGAPQVILSLCSQQSKTKKAFQDQVEGLAQRGYRSLAVALSSNKKEQGMELIGLIGLSDTLREGAGEVVEFLKQNGIETSMVTGDNRAIALEISRELSLRGRVVSKDKLDKLISQKSIDKEFFTKVAAFAEILPEDKLKLVERAKSFFTVASNGDGINDLPALKAANVGIAVKNAVSALKATADIVLLTEGIGVIRDAIVESRKIFARLYTYSLYRISESLRLIVTIAVLGILYRVYPLTPLQIIVVALLNDIPIISLASDRVKITNRPAKINTKKRFTLSSLYGVVGIANSLILFFLLKNILNFDWRVIQTMYFLKLTVSGHMLIYVAHTKERWWKFLPSKGVIWATTLTQLAATILTLTGFLMPSKLSLGEVAFVWGWALFWMQIGEVIKIIKQIYSEKSFGRNISRLENLPDSFNHH